MTFFPKPHIGPQVPFSLLQCTIESVSFSCVSWLSKFGKPNSKISCLIFMDLHGRLTVSGSFADQCGHKASPDPTEKPTRAKDGTLWPWGGSPWSSSTDTFLLWVLPRIESPPVERHGRVKEGGMGGGTGGMQLPNSKDTLTGFPIQCLLFSSFMLSSPPLDFK